MKLYPLLATDLGNGHGLCVRDKRFWDANDLENQETHVEKHKLQKIPFTTCDPN